MAHQDVPLHTIEPIVTPDKFEWGAHRMRVPGGWIYILQPMGTMLSQFVPDPAVTLLTATGEVVPPSKLEEQRELLVEAMAAGATV